MDSSGLLWDVEMYCELVGFFALDASEQRQLIPNETEPKYASFMGGDGDCSRPLQVLFGNLYDLSSRISNHLDEPGYDCFITEDLCYELAEALVKVDENYEAGMFELASLDWEIWNQLRRSARKVWDALDESRRLPLDDWWQYYG